MKTLTQERLSHLNASALDQLIKFLEPLITETRRQKILGILDSRTEHVVPVLEGIFDMGNLHAVVRTTEGLGFHSLDVVESLSHYRSANRVTQGTEKWVDIRKWKSTQECFEDLKSRGYTIACSQLSPQAIDLEQIDFSKKTALVFGNEKQGVSEFALSNADIHFKIPMQGFVQSFNISVAAAIALSYARRAIPQNCRLNPEQKKFSYAHFLLQSLPDPEPVFNRALSCAKESAKVSIG